MRELDDTANFSVPEVDKIARVDVGSVVHRFFALLLICARSEIRRVTEQSAAVEAKATRGGERDSEPLTQPHATSDISCADATALTCTFNSASCRPRDFVELSTYFSVPVRYLGTDTLSHPAAEGCFSMGTLLGLSSWD